MGFTGDIKAAVSFYDRYVGFLKALDIYNIKLNTDYLITDKSIGVLTSQSLDLAVNEMKKLPAMPTAFFCCCDHEAISVIKVLNILGYKVPGDISIISF